MLGEQLGLKSAKKRKEHSPRYSDDDRVHSFSVYTWLLFPVTTVRELTVNYFLRITATIAKIRSQNIKIRLKLAKSQNFHTRKNL